MRRFYFLAVLALIPGLGRAQAVIHQAALDQLAGIAPPRPVIVMPPVAIVRHVSRRVVRRHVPVAAAVAFAPPPQPADLAARSAPSTVPAVARSVPAPPPAANAAKPVPVVARPAPVTAALSFAAGSADLPAGAAGMLKPVCAGAEPSGTVTVDAAAAGVAGDPSVGMRLSMQRAFAVRDALTGCGISPARIIARALGPAAAGGNSDITHVTLGSVP